MPVKVTLTSLSGYNSLTKGSTYSMTVKAKANGYKTSAASAAVKYTVPIPQLSTPTLSVSETTISWTAVANATSYEIYVDNSSYETVSSSMSYYDLTTSLKWSSLSVGTHIVKVRAKASGYTDSAFSNTVVVDSTVDTTVLEAGTYTWIATPAISKTMSADFAFMTNADYYEIIQVRSGSPGNYIDYMNNGSTIVGYYAGHGWGVHTLRNGEWAGVSVEDAYRTITIDDDVEVPTTFYNWAIAQGNLVKSEILEAGTYMWQDIPNAGSVVTTAAPLVQNLEFVSWEENCTSISVYREYDEVSDVSIDYDPVGVAYNADNSAWFTEELQTIVLETDQPVSAEFYQWAIVEENLIKQD